VIDPAIEARIKSLLASGEFSEPEISRLTGTSGWTVDALAAGKRPADPIGPTRRCPTCGGLVEMPCRLCQTRELLASGRLPRVFPGRDRDGEPLHLDLADGNRARYERVRRAHVVPEERP